jgi:3-oxoacyl-[acyl-carrier protein] reductase
MSENPRIVPDRFNGKRALVTGGSRGIGRAIALRLAAEGALVAIGYRSRDDEAAACVEQIAAQGGTAFAIQASIGDPGAIATLFAAWDQEVSTQTGDNRLDVLINNAGVTAAVSLSEIDEQAYDRVFAINTKGPIFVAQQASKRMSAGGRIVSIGSGAAKQPGPMNGAYGMSKAALLAMTRSLAVELGPRGITANVVSPGYTLTEMTSDRISNPEFRDRLIAITALRRIGQPEDVAPIVCFLASEDGGWLTGQWIEATGGYKLVPPI